jgi:hypothetical protein
MGVFDTVIVNCPNCNKAIEFQSKGGECNMYEYTLEDCPDDVLSNINRHSPYICDCGKSLSVNIKNRKVKIL